MGRMRGDRLDARWKAPAYMLVVVLKESATGLFYPVHREMLHVLDLLPRHSECVTAASLVMPR